MLLDPTHAPPRGTVFIPNPLARFTQPSPTRIDNSLLVADLVNLLDGHIRHADPPSPGGAPPPRPAIQAVKDLDAVAAALRPRIGELQALGLPVEPTAATWNSSLVSRLRGHHIQVCREARLAGDTALACLRLAALALDVARREQGHASSAWADLDLAPLARRARELLEQMDAVRALGDIGDPLPGPDSAERAALLDRTIRLLGLDQATGPAGSLAGACLARAIVAPLQAADRGQAQLLQHGSGSIADALLLLGKAESYVRIHDPGLSLQKRRAVAEQIRREADALEQHFLQH